MKKDRCKKHPGCALRSGHGSECLLEAQLCADEILRLQGVIVELGTAADAMRDDGLDRLAWISKTARKQLRP